MRHYLIKIETVQDDEGEDQIGQRVELIDTDTNVNVLAGLDVRAVDFGRIVGTHSFTGAADITIHLQTCQLVDIVCGDPQTYSVKIVERILGDAGK